MRLLYATKNPAKLAYMQHTLRNLPIELDSLSSFPPLQDAPEDGNNPKENARAKALFYHEHYRVPLFSCDSGLYFENLPDALQPGVHVRRVKGQSLNDDEMIDYYAGLAKRYGSITAYYQNAICLILGPNQIYEADDETLRSQPFFLVERPHAKRVPGFPLDSLSQDPVSGSYYYDLPPDQNLDPAQPNGFSAFFTRSLNL